MNIIAASKHPERGSKRRSGQFSYKSGLLSKKVCYKVSSSESCQRQSWKAFTGLSNRARMVGGGVPVNINFVHKVNRLRSLHSHATIWIRSKKVNASSFLAPTVFGAQYHLPIIFRPPCSAVSVLPVMYVAIANNVTTVSNLHKFSFLLLI